MSPTQPGQRIEALVQDPLDHVRAALWHALLQDHLTGLRNRYALDADRESLPVGERLAVVAVELNGFKNLNTRYTHGGGDMVLGDVGQRLHGFAEERRGWEAYHVSGDEFELLVTGHHFAGGRGGAELLKRELEDEPYGVPGGNETEPGEVTVTIAVAHRDEIGGAASRSQLRQLADELAEFAKFRQDLHLPPVLTEEEAGEEFPAYRDRLSNSSRQRLHCPRCGRSGYLNIPLDFQDCPDCQLLGER